MIFRSRWHCRRMVETFARRTISSSPTLPRRHSSGPASGLLLGTNIISKAIKPLPSKRLLEWRAEQTDESLLISSLSLAEIWRGILEKPAGKKRRELEEWFSGTEGPQA